MRLHDFYLQLRRPQVQALAKDYCQAQADAQTEQQPRPDASQPAHRERNKMTLEAMTRPAQTRSLKALLRQH